jgi:hypothetical protein
MERNSEKYIPYKYQIGERKDRKRMNNIVRICSAIIDKVESKNKELDTDFKFRGFTSFITCTVGYVTRGWTKYRELTVIESSDELGLRRKITVVKDTNDFADDFPFIEVEEEIRDGEIQHFYKNANSESVYDITNSVRRFLEGIDRWEKLLPY